MRDNIRQECEILRKLAQNATNKRNSFMEEFKRGEKRGDSQASDECFASVVRCDRQVQIYNRQASEFISKETNTWEFFDKDIIDLHG